MNMNKIITNRSLKGRGAPTVQHLLLFQKTVKDSADALVLPILFNLLYIVSSLVGQIKKLNGEHVAPGPQFAHAWSKVMVTGSKPALKTRSENNNSPFAIHK